MVVLFTPLWKIIIHGCINGYSRLIVYLHCANNNLASTGLQQFAAATYTYGLPSRVCGDHGSENVDVADFMILHCGHWRGSFLCGRSVHNQSIERLWRDVFSGCPVLYYQLNELHLFCRISSSYLV